MPTPQQSANDALARWQSLRAERLSPSERMEVLMRDFFAPPPPADFEYEMTIRQVASVMEAA